MGLLEHDIQDHIDEWNGKLQSISSWSYRAKWPKYLFRHEPLENAVQIIQSGQLLARCDSEKIDHLDIAAPDVVSSRKDAQTFARLYFRPLNPTQYNVEGIRKTEDLYQSNSQIHAPILVMFLFSASSVLSMSETNFSNGNMQGFGSEYGGTLNFFKTIRFDQVFHEGAFSRDEKDVILKARCAEVLTQSPLLLTKHLIGIRCRSTAEKQTLLHLCGNKIPVDFKSKIRVYSEVGLFQSRHTYVKDVDLSSTGLKFTLNPRFDSKEVNVSLEIATANGDIVCRVRSTMIDPAKTQKLTKSMPDDSYIITIWLENHLAYKAVLTIDDFPF